MTASFSSFSPYNVPEQLTSCRVVSESALTVVYYNGPSNNGIGATLTNAGAQAALSIDGVTLAVNDRVLVNGQSSAFQNGIYTVQNVGGSSSNWVLIRAKDFQSGAQMRCGMFCTIEAGSLNAGAMFALVEPKPNVVGVDSIVFNSGQALGLGTAASKAASDNSKAILSSVAVPTIINHLAVFTDTNGTLGEDVSTAINGGNLQAGLSGTAGTVASFPATASRGSLLLKGVANTGNTNTTISNAAMGQASVVSIPDPVAATANFAVLPAAVSSGTVAVFSGTSGLLGNNPNAFTVKKSGTSASFASLTVTDANIQNASNVVCVPYGNTNAVAIQSIAVSAGQFVATFTGAFSNGTGLFYFCSDTN